MSDAPKRPHGGGARSLARKLALQALYGWQLNRRDWQELVREFELAEEAPRADRAHYESLLREITDHEAELDAELAPLLDRPAAELDPVEHAALWIGLAELRACPDVPFRVAVSEAVNLARRFGATDGHKFVNAVLDRAARLLRPDEH